MEFYLFHFHVKPFFCSNNNVHRTSGSKCKLILFIHPLNLVFFRCPTGCNLDAIFTFLSQGIAMPQYI